MVTGWAVGLTCCISHSAKHRKIADFDPTGSPNPEPISMNPGMVDYVRDPTPRDNFGRVAQRGWSVQTCDLSHLRVSFFIIICNSMMWLLWLRSIGRGGVWEVDGPSDGHYETQHRVLRRSDDQDIRLNCRGWLVHLAVPLSQYIWFTVAGSSVHFPASYTSNTVTASDHLETVCYTVDVPIIMPRITDVTTLTVPSCGVLSFFAEIKQENN